MTMLDFNIKCRYSNSNSIAISYFNDSEFDVIEQYITKSLDLNINKDRFWYPEAIMPFEFSKLTNPLTFRIPCIIVTSSNQLELIKLEEFIKTLRTRFYSNICLTLEKEYLEKILKPSTYFIIPSYAKLNSTCFAISTSDKDLNLFLTLRD